MIKTLKSPLKIPTLRPLLLLALFLILPLQVRAQSVSPAMASSLLQGAANANVLGGPNSTSAGKIDAATIRNLTGASLTDSSGDNAKDPSSAKKSLDNKADTDSLKTNVANQPNAFQTYIVQSTGRILPIYGQNLFSLSNPYSSIEVANVPSDYVLGPGDELQVKVYSPSIDVDQRFVINREGMIVLPKIGPISLAGTKVSGLEARLKNELSQTLSDFNLYVSMGQLRGIEVYVTGQARSPGKHNLSSVSTMINALFATGGPSSNGSMRNIQLLRGGKVINTIDLYDFLSKGNRGMDTRLLPGDVINIPPIGQQVALMGITPTPSIYELTPKRQNSLAEIIALAGGLSALNSPMKASLERIEQGATNPLTAYAIDLRGDGMKMTLRDGDMVTLLPINPSFSNAVSLRILNNTVRLPLTDHARITDLIPNQQALITPDYFYRRFNTRIVPNGQTGPANAASGVANAMSGYFGQQEIGTEKNAISTKDIVRIRNNFLSDQFNLESVMIERVSTQSLKPQLISINLNRAWADKNSDQNILLQAGDIISVYSYRDIQVPIDRQSKIVRIQGEVNAPGIYQIKGNETLRDLITRAGGITEQAYLYGTQLSRDSVRENQRKNIEVIIKRLEEQITTQEALALRNVQDSQATALLRTQNQARLREKITQLRTAAPSGRVALELDARRTKLPNIMLEQGDEVNIPSVPSDVSVVGAVYNENALIYRPEKTVREYLKLAGVAVNADVESAFILRADGSLVAPDVDPSLFSNLLFSGSKKIDQLTLMPGDVVFVPEKLIKESNYSAFMRGLRDWTQVIFQLGLGAASVKVLSQ
jgi:protein involved in polysaccharide export with SLBB domain